jgi:hypothetical protein
VAEPLEVLQDPGVVEAELLVDLIDRLLGCARTEDVDRRVTRQQLQQEEREEGDSQEHR